MTTAMTPMFRMTTSASAQVRFIGMGCVAQDGTLQVLSGRSNSGRPLSGPEPRHSTEREGWLDPKRDVAGDCQSPRPPRTASYPRQRTLSSATRALTAR